MEGEEDDVEEAKRRVDERKLQLVKTKHDDEEQIGTEKREEREIMFLIIFF